ncbi:ASCH domain-containing protein [Maribacter sp. 2307ULW6-5]|uniref:ASCH domain-containing protein n=1 Tax=Maribacter sp. 2307ULW6-5 TaxID=3386275 RepID=UPI0039BD5F15
MNNPSARKMWDAFLTQHSGKAQTSDPDILCFCDNKEDSDRCAQLVKQGKKTATSYSLLGLQYREAPLPKKGAYKVVTNWEGEAQCIIETTSVALKPYFAIDEEHAKGEGMEGDALATWKREHWDHFTRELEPYGRVPRESMIVVCVNFRVVYPVR